MAMYYYQSSNGWRGNYRDDATLAQIKRDAREMSWTQGYVKVYRREEKGPATLIYCAERGKGHRCDEV